MTLKPEEAVKLYKENYIKDYLKDLEPMYAKDEAEKEDSASILAWYSYYKGIESHVQYYKNICWFTASTTMNIPEAHMVFICLLS